MRTKVVFPPDPVMTPADIPGSHAADDATVTALIAAATAVLDGPQGWLGIAIGPQTLEMYLSEFPCEGEIELDCPPVIDVESVDYVDENGDPQTLSADGYSLGESGKIVLAAAATWPATAERADAVRIRYTAGYNGFDVDSGGTGDVPTRLLQAIHLQVKHLQAVGVDNLFLKRVKVEGVGEREYIVSDQADMVVAQAVKHLCGGLRKVVL